MAVMRLMLHAPVSDNPFAKRVVGRRRGPVEILAWRSARVSRAHASKEPLDRRGANVRHGVNHYIELARDVVDPIHNALRIPIPELGKPQSNFLGEIR